MDKYEKILKLIKAVNDKYPEYCGFLYIMIFDDESGHFECSNGLMESRPLESFSSPASGDRSLNDLFVKFGIE